jgi:hypothetical protein
VLGAPQGTTIIYVEGDPSYLAGCKPANSIGSLAFQPGFNLVSEPIYPTFTGTAQLLPLSTEIDIALTADPSLSSYLCQPGTFGGSSGVGGVAAVQPCADPSCAPPQGAAVACSPDNSSYAWTATPTSPSLCGYYNNAGGSNAGVVALPAGSTVPNGWPCQKGTNSCAQVVACVEGCSPSAVNSCVPACIVMGTTAAQALLQPLQDCAKPACDTGSNAPCADPGSTACQSCLNANCSAQLNACLQG